MKNMTKLFAFLAIASFAFTSCGDTTGEIAYPSIEKVTMEEKSDGTFFGRFDVTCVSTESIKDVTASYTYGSTTLSVPEKNLDITKGKSNEWTIKVTTPVEVEGARVSKITISATVKGATGGTKTESFNTPKSEEPTDEELNEPLAFSFTRVGSNAATGDLTKFGLVWTSNETNATSVVLKKGAATKFVELTTANWSGITTKAALKTAIDNATSMESYKGISADKGGAHDIVLGTLNGGTYYILQITKSTVDYNATTGTTIVISGASKN